MRLSAVGSTAKVIGRTSLFSGGEQQQPLERARNQESLRESLSQGRVGNLHTRKRKGGGWETDGREVYEELDNGGG
jgi:hypothetical protein